MQLPVRLTGVRDNSAFVSTDCFASSYDREEIATDVIVASSREVLGEIQSFSALQRTLQIWLNLKDQWKITVDDGN